MIEQEIKKIYGIMNLKLGIMGVCVVIMTFLAIINTEHKYSEAIEINYYMISQIDTLTVQVNKLNNQLIHLTDKHNQHVLNFDIHK